jgi:hypothetical protein
MEDVDFLLMPRLPGEEEVGDDSSKDGVLTVITCN